MDCFGEFFGFCCWSSFFACGQTVLHKPQLRIGSICPGSLHTPAYILCISLHHSHPSVRLLFSFFCFLSLHFSLWHISPSPFFPWVPCSSSNTAGTHQHLYQLWLPAIYSHTHSRWAVTQRSSRTPTDRQEAHMMQRNPAQTHMWLISWCNRLNSLSWPGNTRQAVDLFASSSKHTHSTPDSAGSGPDLCLWSVFVISISNIDFFFFYCMMWVEFLYGRLLCLRTLASLDNWKTETGIGKFEMMPGPFCFNTWKINKIIVFMRDGM